MPEIDDEILKNIVEHLAGQAASLVAIEEVLRAILRQTPIDFGAVRQEILRRISDSWSSRAALELVDRLRNSAYQSSPKH